MRSTKKSAAQSSRFLAIALAGVAMAASFAYVACDSSDNAVKETNPTPDSGTLPDGAPVPVTDSAVPPDSATLPDGAPSDCFTNPKTHFEIINACTNAVKITKNPTLPLLLADGGLPPLN